MRSHGVHFQPPLSGALHVARTNAFFMGGGKALVNAYFRSAERLGVKIRYNAQVTDIELKGGSSSRRTSVNVRSMVSVFPPSVSGQGLVLAAGGFESNREWLREAWGQNERGEWPSDNFLIRGTRFNTGVLLRRMRPRRRYHRRPDPSAHGGIDARAPLYDGGICTRIDCVSLGVVVNRDGERFYDEGEDFWPKRYAIWGRLVAGQPGQQAYSIIDQQALGRFMPPVFPGTKGRLPWKSGPPVEASRSSNSSKPSRNTTRPAASARSITPHWTIATPKVDTRQNPLGPPAGKPPFYAYPLKPGMTFTYLGLATDETAAVHFHGKPSPTCLSQEK